MATTYRNFDQFDIIKTTKKNNQKVIYEPNNFTTALAATRFTR